MKIKTIITAIGNKKLNERLIEENYNVICTDIQYKEGVLEFLEANSMVNYVILNQDLDGNIPLEELISEIKKINKNIKIIFTSNKSFDEEKIINILKKEIEKNNNYLKEKNIINNLIIDTSIKENSEIKNKINNEKIINNKTKNNKINNNLNKSNINLKNNNIYNKINNNFLNKNNENNSEKNININKIEKSQKIFNKKTLPLANLFNMKNIVNERQKDVISILGPNGIGKSVFSILFAKTMESKRSIIIDFDVLNKSLHTLMGIKNYEGKIKKKIKSNDLINNNNNFQKNIIHTNLKIDLLPAMNIILDSNYKLSNKKMKNIIEELKNNYDLIIIDNSSEAFFDYTREMINNSNKAIFISGANLLEVRKSERLLEIYTKDWNIEKEKINIVFNKCTNKSLDETILREIFGKYNILGKIKLNDYYDFAINKNMDEKEKLQKEIEEIKKLIIKEKYYGTN